MAPARTIHVHQCKEHDSWVGNQQEAGTARQAKGLTFLHVRMQDTSVSHCGTASLPHNFAHRTDEESVYKMRKQQQDYQLQNAAFRTPLPRWFRAR